MEDILQYSPWPLWKFGHALRPHQQACCLPNPHQWHPPWHAEPICLYISINFFNLFFFLRFFNEWGQMRIDPFKVQVVADWPALESHKQLQCLLGFALFYRLFICDYSTEATPLTQLIYTKLILSSFGPTIKTLPIYAQQGPLGIPSGSVQLYLHFCPIYSNIILMPSLISSPSPQKGLSSNWSFPPSIWWP